MKVYYEDELVTLYHGDCREILPTIHADVMVTDPPYGVGHRSGWSDDLYGATAEAYQQAEGDAIQGDGDTSLRDEVLAIWEPLPALVFGSWRAPFPKGSKTALIWEKGENAGMGDLSIPWKPNWEMIFVLGSGGFKGDRTAGVLHAQVPARVALGRVHPNEKPVSLMRELVGKCYPLATIVDPFAGSGSTLVAAKQIGRKAIGIEISEAYCEMAAKRLAQGVLFGASV